MPTEEDFSIGLENRCEHGIWRLVVCKDCEPNGYKNALERLESEYSDPESPFRKSMNKADLDRRPTT